VAFLFVFLVLFLIEVLMNFRFLGKALHRLSNVKFSSGKFNPAKYIPTWQPEYTLATHAVFWTVMSKCGVTDVRSYFQRLAALIAACVAVGVLAGGYYFGFWGAVLGGLAGLAGPVILIYGAMLILIALGLSLIFIAVWSFIVWAFFYILFY